MTADRDEKIATLIHGSVSSLEINLTKYLAESDEAEISHLQQRLASLEFEARQLVSPEGQSSE